MRWSIRIWVAWSIKGDSHRCVMCLAIVMWMSSICLHLHTRSWQSQNQHWSDTLYHRVGVVKLNILNQFGPCPQYFSNMHCGSISFIPFEYPLNLFKSWPLIPTICMGCKSTTLTYFFLLFVPFHDNLFDASANFTLKAVYLINCQCLSAILVMSTCL